MGEHVGLDEFHVARVSKDNLAEDLKRPLGEVEAVSGQFLNLGRSSGRRPC